MNYLQLALAAIIFCGIWQCAPAPRETSSVQATDTDTLVPIMGHRFVITGDFDGDGQLDTLTERYTSQGLETNKFYEGIGYDSLVALAVQKEKQCYLQASGKIDSLFVSDEAQLFGLAYLKNEGDLDGDGADEIGYVVDWADWSNMNTYYIYSYKNNAWDMLEHFDIWDWQLPWYDTSIKADTFQGLITKIANKRIRIQTPRKGELSTDTLDLK